MLTWQLTQAVQRKAVQQSSQQLPSVIPMRLLALPLSRHMDRQGKRHVRNR